MASIYHLTKEADLQKALRKGQKLRIRMRLAGETHNLPAGEQAIGVGLPSGDHAGLFRRQEPVSHGRERTEIEHFLPGADQAS